MHLRRHVLLRKNTHPQWATVQSKHSAACVATRRSHCDDVELCNTRFMTTQGLCAAIPTLPDARAGLGLQALQQAAGINTVMYYTPAILELAGFRDKRSALLIAMLPAGGAGSLIPSSDLVHAHALHVASSLLHGRPVLRCALFLPPVRHILKGGRTCPRSGPRPGTQCSADQLAVCMAVEKGKRQASR